MDINGDILSIILQMLGVKNVRAETDHPDAKLFLHFERYGQVHKIEYRLGDLVDQLQGPKTAPGEAPEGFTDIASLPDPSSG